MHDIVRDHRCGFADQYCIAVPAHGIDLYIQRNRPIVAVHLEQLLGNSSGPCAKTAVSLLQRDNIGVDLVQHVYDPAGVATPVGAHPLVDIITCDLQH